MRKGDTVFYVCGRDVIRAKVLVAHRDGSAKIEAQFHVREGRDYFSYLGYVYELDAEFIHENEMQADIAIRQMMRSAA